MLLLAEPGSMSSLCAKHELLIRADGDMQTGWMAKEERGGESSDVTRWVRPAS